jgi:opacity protein-like surface antigen
MKNRLMLGALAAVLTTSAFAADVTGKWTAQVPGRDGQTRETTFNLTATGETVTGTVSGRNGDNPISEGTVKGDDLSFAVKVNFGGNDMKLLYTGKLAGDEIKFTRTREGGDQGGQEFTATRAK